MEQIKLTQTAEFNLDSLYPSFPLPLKPFGDRVFVQIQAPREKTAGGIILSDETKDGDLYNQQTAKILALGPKAKEEEDYLAEGLYVRVPLYGGDKIKVKHGDKIGHFVTYRAREILGEVLCDPLDIKTTLV